MRGTAGADDFVRQEGTAVLVDVKVQPRARRQGVVGVEGARVKIALTAPPVDGAANDALVLFLAEALGVPRRAVQIVRGQTSRLKTVRIEDATADAVRRALTERPG